MKRPGRSRTRADLHATRPRAGRVGGPVGVSRRRSRELARSADGSSDPTVEVRVRPVCMWSAPDLKAASLSA